MQPETPNTRSPHATLLLPPELRNAVYTHLLLSAKPLWLVPSPRTPQKFRLREHAPQDHAAILCTLHELSRVSRATSQEARSFFYARNSVRLVTYAYEYLPLFTSYLRSLGRAKRGMLGDLAMTGLMYSSKGEEEEEELQKLLGGCTALRKLELQLNVRQFCASDLDGLARNLRGGSELPRVDFSGWARVIARLERLERVRFLLTEYVDEAAVREGGMLAPEDVERSRVDALARALEVQLVEAVRLQGKCVDIDVTYDGGRRMPYWGVLWH
ncbi:hypothetical protein BU26DRAFT_519103 [Trematosphaeria pertusa]|uniref:F-box domain-containing protein n=1 Tax=Trematosphaeria pertusa TaxID=390896 RepID=A0A6A6IH66_9PLEO|nr:uncharacterized protein BU26DRAFT_519103 [Trematosphaeria pertusa]KAF2248910.1 hypothetical protein BU26DRAFT_519103 [Trematosphaeria pertusa]